MSSQDKVFLFELNAWLKSQWSNLEEASAAVERNERREEAIVQIEEIVRSYKEKADEGSIFETVFGFEETVFCAMEILAVAYARVSRFDEALVLHRYVAETVQSIVRGRHRNRQHLQDVRDNDIDHISGAAVFLMYFSRYTADQGEVAKAWQLLNEATDLSGRWDLTTRRPEVGRAINAQIEALRRSSKQDGT